MYHQVFVEEIVAGVDETAPKCAFSSISPCSVLRL
jgi:hypothetical protein